jgi:hypothetical protein
MRSIGGNSMLLADTVQPFSQGVVERSPTRCSAHSCQTCSASIDPKGPVYLLLAILGVSRCTVSAN